MNDRGHLERATDNVLNVPDNVNMAACSCGHGGFEIWLWPSGKIWGIRCTACQSGIKIRQGSVAHRMNGKVN